MKAAEKASVKGALQAAYAERVRKNGKKKAEKSYTEGTERRAQRAPRLVFCSVLSVSRWQESRLWNKKMRAIIRRRSKTDIFTT